MFVVFSIFAVILQVVSPGKCSSKILHKLGTNSLPLASFEPSNVRPVIGENAPPNVTGIEEDGAESGGMVEGWGTGLEATFLLVAMAPSAGKKCTTVLTREKKQTGA